MVARGRYEPNELRTPALAEGQGDFLLHIKLSRIAVTGRPLSLNRKCHTVSGAPCICWDILGGGQTDQAPPPSATPSGLAEGEICGGYWMEWEGAERSG